MSTSDYTVEDLLDGLDDAKKQSAIDWTAPKGAPQSLKPLRIDIGFGNFSVEVAVATADRAPKMDDVRRLWSLRWGHRANPVLLIVSYPTNAGWQATVCGPDEDSAAIPGLDLRQVGRTAIAALAEPNESAAKRTLTELLVSTKDQLVAGLVNQGLFASHELRSGVPARADWASAQQRGRHLVGKTGQDLIAGLGYASSPLGSVAQVLSGEGDRRAIAVLLDESEVFDRPSQRFGSISPVSVGLATAQEHNLPWLLVVKADKIRLYPTRPGIGVGRKGQSETYVELSLTHLADDDAGYLPLLFAAEALADGGSVTQILTASTDHATGLGERLRDRVYVDVVPALAVAVAGAMKSAKQAPLSDSDLTEAYHRTLIILFRLLFVAYAEDRGLLPYNRNPRYTKKALKTMARELAEDADLTFDRDSFDRWADLQSVWRAVDNGNREWGVPAYNGGLFSTDSELHPSSHAISHMRLSNAEIGPALRALLVDMGEDGINGPVDFRALSVREFGTIYEGLLESSLSIAPEDLKVDPRSLAFVPAKGNDPITVPAGEVYFHNASGARKATGSYFTKGFAVEYLLDTALEPAITDHLASVKTLLDQGEETSAAERFFDFRVADLAMGSGHFLVAAIDRIEARFAKFVAHNPISAIGEELDRLAAAAVEALGEQAPVAEIEPSMLLRRQVARRCIYGLDLNVMAVELARLAIWIHTFVPGLPMSSLAHGLRVGNSLTGITTVDEALRIFEPKSESGQFSIFGEQIEEALSTARDRLLRVARTAEATKAEVREAARSHSAAMDEASDAKTLFDLALVVRLGEAPPPSSLDDALRIGSSAEVRAIADRLQSAHLPYLFPEAFLRARPGFDVILGNPPWDKVRHEAQQFWVVRDPGLNALPSSARDAHIEMLRKTRTQDAAEEVEEQQFRELLQAVAKCSYSLLGSGHFDFAKMFAERFLTASRIGGCIGVVMPQSLLLLGGWAKLRTALLDRGDVEVVETRNTNGWMFDDVDGRITVAMLSIRPPKDDSSHQVVILPGVTSLDRFNRVRASGAMTMSVADIDELSEGRVIPWFNSPDDSGVFTKMRARPKLDSPNGWVRGKSDSARWDFSGSGKHKAYASTTRTGPDSWAVLMTRHVDQFAIADDPIQRWVNEPLVLAAKQSARGLELDFSGTARLAIEHPLITYRFPSRNDDSRTIIATALPASGYLFSTGYSHGITHPSGTDTARKLALLGYLNTLVADWWARRFVDRHVGSRIINGLPLPDWTDAEVASAADLARELLVRGGLSSLPGGELIASSAQLQAYSEEDLRIRLDVCACQGFELAVEDVEVILRDFKEKAESVPRAYRSALLAAFRSAIHD